jgi:hypothetical protein
MSYLEGMHKGKSEALGDVKVTLERALREARIEGRDHLRFCDLSKLFEMVGMTAPSASASASASAAASVSASSPGRETAESVRAELAAKHPGVTFVEVRGGTSD